MYMESYNLHDCKVYTVKKHISHKNSAMRVSIRVVFNNSKTWKKIEELNICGYTVELQTISELKDRTLFGYWNAIGL